jgi:hypothetical protein
MAPPLVRIGAGHGAHPADAPLHLSPEAIAATCGLSPGDLALLAGLSPDRAIEEPWHPRLQALLRNLVELFSRARAAAPPFETGDAFWAAHRALRPLGGRTLVEAVADDDWNAVDAYLDRPATMR